MNQLAFAKLVNFVSTDIVQLGGKAINIINESAVSSNSANNEIQFYIPDEMPLGMLNSPTARNFYNWLSTLINIKLEHYDDNDKPTQPTK